MIVYIFVLFYLLIEKIDYFYCNILMDYNEEFYKILNKEDPDYLLENFWGTYKLCFSNFYKKYPHFLRPIRLWCYNLNLLKKNKFYDKIQKCIYNYLILQSCDIMKTRDRYHMRILKTNIIRYIKLCNEIDFYIFDKELDKLENIFKIYLRLIDYEEDDFLKSLFGEIEMPIFYENYDNLFVYSIENGKSSIIDRLRNITDVNDIIKRLYNKDIKYDISGKKLLKILKSE